ncbi:hydroxyacid dehydrogenase [Burkholderia sp. Leaf177]|uniref:FAD-binding oxidoreductase n=1 Tax=Burkholderia sp. Leaf177 TaxID=1736287 RepID=UPI0006FFB0BD|nr:FAD-binding oxidoreductase [Burkholderia sp. Leaf177]KQR77156.1 hydroxyacid dehydrogenase [Burkholderia sp. Leaf177]
MNAVEPALRSLALNAVVERIKAIVGDAGWLQQADDIEPHLIEHRGLYRGNTALVVRPSSTAQVSEVVALCASAGVTIIPQGGNTGLCGAGVPPEDGDNIVLSMGRMRQIRSIDPGNFAITVEAGCILADIQQEADKYDRLFPLSLGAQGSCQIGGNLSTNAGGLQVLRYGNARELTLGVEVVLPDGRVLNGLRALRKDNTGYDLKHLFIGAEGTLGIITAATLRLFPKPVCTGTALFALTSLDAVIDLLALARAQTADLLTAFEFIPRFGIEIASQHVAGVRDPLPAAYPWYVLLEMSTSSPHAELNSVMETLFESAMEAGGVVDGVVAVSEQQRLALWKIREAVVEAQKAEGASIKYDVSVPVTSIPRFVDEAIAACRALLPGVRPLAFGHFGDGNVHFNLTAPAGGDERFVPMTEHFDRAVFDLVTQYEGSISAEHGIGRTKRGALAHYKSAVELDLMRQIKAVLDPGMLFNPDKLLLPAAAPPRRANET